MGHEALCFPNIKQVPCPELLQHRRDRKQLKPKIKKKIKIVSHILWLCTLEANGCWKITMSPRLAWDSEF